MKDKKKRYWTLLVLLIVILIAGIAAAVYFSGKRIQRRAAMRMWMQMPRQGTMGIDTEEPREITENILVPGYSGAEMKAGDTTLSLADRKPGGEHLLSAGNSAIGRWNCIV